MEYGVPVEKMNGENTSGNHRKFEFSLLCLGFGLDFNLNIYT